MNRTKTTSRSFLLATVATLFVLTISCNQEPPSQQTSTPEPQEVTAPNKNKESEVVETTEFQEGDLVFQSSRSGQSLAIQLATDSKWSHMGILLMHEGELQVFEAWQPVRFRSIADWKKGGDDGVMVVKRLKEDGQLSTMNLIKMRKFASNWSGLDYDALFEWSDEKMYCSEVVWKLYQRTTGLEIGELATLGSFDLSNPIVSAKVKERYGDDVPLDQNVISPDAMFNSPLLVTVME